MRAYFQLNSGTIIETESPEAWASDPNAKRLSAAKGKALLKEQSIARLRETLKPGDTVQCVLRHVSSSGMSRRIDFYVIRDNEPQFLTGHIGHACDYKHSEAGGLVVGGCGMDMGFAVVYDLSRILFTPFTCIGKGCPSNDHSNGDRNYEPHEHSDGGYALRHRWI